MCACTLKGTVKGLRAELHRDLLSVLWISEIKECDKDRRKRVKMTERGHGPGNNNKKRKVSASSPLLSTTQRLFDY